MGQIENKNLKGLFDFYLCNERKCKNIFERNIQDLAISTSELNEIYKLLENKEKIEVKNIIITAYQDVLYEFKLDNGNYKKYIEKNIDDIIVIIINAVKQETLDKMFITQKFIEY